MNVSTSEIDSSRAYHGWFQLSPRPPDTQSVLQDKVDLGTMRLSVSYSQDRIFPLEMYRPLQTLLLQTLEVLVRRQEWLRVQFEYVRDAALVSPQNESALIGKTYISLGGMHMHREHS